MKRKLKFIYGPVPSRRLGLSLGVDLVPYKVCSFDCIYCQLGRSQNKTIERSEYIPPDKILENLFEALPAAGSPDFITLAGSGEPTLNSSMGKIIEEIKKKTSIPVAVLTNGSLFSDSTVRKDLLAADLVLPSLDADDEETFKKINRPHENIHFSQVVEGLKKFRKEFPGQIWLEVFLLKNINVSEDQIEKIKDHIESIRPDKVQLNTAVRPPAEKDAIPLDYEDLERLCSVFGKNTEVIAESKRSSTKTLHNLGSEEILAVLSRRPCRLIDLARGLGMEHNQILKVLDQLQKEGKIRSEYQNNEQYYLKTGTKLQSIQPGSYH